MMFPEAALPCVLPKSITHGVIDLHLNVLKIAQGNSIEMLQNINVFIHVQRLLFNISLIILLGTVQKNVQQERSHNLLTTLV